MNSSLATEHGASLMMIEGGLTAIAIGVAFCWPRICAGFFSRIEKVFAQLARRQGLAVIVVGLSAVLLRLAILPMVPVPHPFYPDDFSFLLAAETFASGRLSNPTPVMWEHFESFHITMKPTYTSMYFPADGVVLAAGKVLFGHPWIGLLCSMGLMCAAICWMLQAWLPPKWALLGGVLAVLRLGLFSYWINTYSGAGSIAALGGALVLGACPRFMKTAQMRYSLLMAVGIVLLATSRPYEGVLLCLPVVIVLGRWMLFGKNRPAMSAVVRRIAFPVAVIIAAMVWMGYYDYRAFGNPLTPPYQVNRATYAVAPYYVWQHVRPEPVYRHAVMREFYTHYELLDFGHVQTLLGFVPQSLIKAARAARYFSGIALLFPLIMLPRVVRDRRIRFLLVSTAVLIAGMAIEIFLFPHYIAPFTAVFYAIGLQAMRHLRVWMPGGQPVGVALTRLIVSLCFVMCILRVDAERLHLQVPESSTSEGLAEWYGPGEFGTDRAQIESKLERMSGRQLVIVRYAEHHNPINEWVYNAPDIDKSNVIWAREMDESKNLELIRYYKDRKVWLVQPDLQPAGLSSYPLPKTNFSPATDSSRFAKSEMKVQQGG
jgi:hypothetical protein